MKLSIGWQLLKFTLSHWKYLIFEADNDIDFEAKFFFDTLAERAGLWNE